MLQVVTHLISRVIITARTMARLMVGLPDYEAYVAHRRTCHPNEPVMSYEQFFENRQMSRYGASGGKISRCC